MTSDTRVSHLIDVKFHDGVDKKCREFLISTTVIIGLVDV